MTADLRKAMGMSPEDTHSEGAKSSAIKLAGATMVGRVGGGVTPLPRSMPVGTPQEQSGTQVAAPKTVVAGAVAAPAAPAAPTALAVPVAAKKRPGWIIPVAISAVLVVIGGGVIVALSSQGGAVPAPTPTIASATSAPTPTTAASATPTAVPLTAQLWQLQENTEMRDKAGSDASSRIEGQLPAGTQFFVKARTADSQWVRIETPDGTTGWIMAQVTGLTADQLEDLPVATTLTRLTDTPTATVPPTETPTFTPTPLPTATTGPTRTPAPTKAPATQAPTVPPASPTAPAAAEPLGYGFQFQFCTYDGDNYTCNVSVWGNGGDGKYHFALENPDTGNWDEKTGGSANYLMRSRRCRVKVQQLRIWDESGNHIEPNLTMDPNAMPDKFPGGAGCSS
jgi:hypothetical protein